LNWWALWYGLWRCVRPINFPLRYFHFPRTQINFTNPAVGSLAISWNAPANASPVDQTFTRGLDLTNEPRQPACQAQWCVLTPIHSIISLTNVAQTPLLQPDACDILKDSSNDGKSAVLSDLRLFNADVVILATGYKS
jgi:hypothetical protein